LHNEALQASVHRRSADIDRSIDDVDDVDDLAVYAQLARSRTRHIDQVANQSRHVHDLPLDDGLHSRQRRLCRRNVAEGCGRVADWRKWGSQLVGDQGEKLRLSSMRLLGDGVQFLGAERGQNQLLVGLPKLRSHSLVLGCRSLEGRQGALQRCQ